jgi:excisionase family DNA binding protein
LARKRTLTISEAAELTGLSRKAIARRVERGSLRSLVRRGRRLIPRAELVRAGLIPPEGRVGETDFEPLELLGPRSHAPQQSLSARDESVLAVLLRELVARLERQAGEIAHYRALTSRAESLRLEGEISELSARLRRLEGARPLLGLERGLAEEESLEGGSPTGVDRLRVSQRQRSGQPIWLPPSATEPSKQRQAGREPTAPIKTTHSGRSTASLSQRLFPLALETLFLVSVAVLAWRAALRPAMVISAMAVSWLLVAVIEWVRWNRS